jgi:hypothetical protein
MDDCFFRLFLFYLDFSLSTWTRSATCSTPRSCGARTSAMTVCEVGRGGDRERGQSECERRELEGFIFFVDSSSAAAVSLFSSTLQSLEFCWRYESSPSTTTSSTTLSTPATTMRKKKKKNDNNNNSNNNKDKKKNRKKRNKP